MNTRMQLSFIKPKPFALTQASWLSWLAFGVCLLMALFALQHMMSLQDRVSASEQQVQQARAALPSQTQTETAATFELPKRQVTMIKQAVHQLSIPWQPLFATVEQTKHASIALLELSPSDQKNLVVLRGEAKTLDAVFAYIRALETSSALDKVYLQNHTVDNTDRSKPVTFTIYADWKG